MKLQGLPLHANMRYLAPHQRGWSRLEALLTEYFGSSIGWEYIGTNQAGHQLKHPCDNPTLLKPLAGNVRHSGYGPNLFTIGKYAFFYADEQSSDWTTAIGDVSINPMVAVPVNDYVCKRCSNPKCSKTEKSCWKCGEAIAA